MSGGQHVHHEQEIRAGAESLVAKYRLIRCRSLPAAINRGSHKLHGLIVTINKINRSEVSEPGR